MICQSLSLALDGRWKGEKCTEFWLYVPYQFFDVQQIINHLLPDSKYLFENKLDVLKEALANAGSLVGRPQTHQKTARAYQEPNWGVVSEAQGESRSHSGLVQTTLSELSKTMISPDLFIKFH